MRNLVVFCALSVLIGVSTNLQAKVLQTTTKGQPEIKSIQAISFASDGVLLIGDGTGSQIFAIKTGDVSKSGTLKSKIENIDAKIAGRLGTKADGIEIIDFAVNPASGTPYFAVRKQAEKVNLILTVDATGGIHEFELDNVEYARVKLSAGKVIISRITDVAWSGRKSRRGWTW